MLYIIIIHSRGNLEHQSTLYFKNFKIVVTNSETHFKLIL